MGMGYGANYADVMEDEDVKKLCPYYWKRFADAINEDEEMEDVDDFARELYFDEIDENDSVMVAYKALCQALYNETEGLEFSLGFHDHEDNGDRYDEVNGHYWSVDGLYELTKAGKKFHDKVDRKFFVTFG